MNIQTDYSRQQDLDFSTSPGAIIVGAGGIGYWVGILAAMVGVKDIVIIDSDRLEATNLNRIPAPKHDEGKLKVSSLRKVIKILRPATKCLSVPYHVLNDTQLLENIVKSKIGFGIREFIIYDCTDDARIQKCISESMPKLKSINSGRYVGYVKIAYEGYKIGMYKTMNNIWITDDYRPGYVTASANALSSCFAAVLGMLYANECYFSGNTANGIDIDMLKLILGEEDAIKYDR